MGGGGSTEHHYHTNTVYQTPPEVVKQLEDATIALKKVEAEAIERGDPTLYKRNEDNLFNNFIEKLPQLELADIIVKETGREDIGFMGLISAGKTTMINTMFSLNLPVALGHCTTVCEMVHREGANNIWDVPGSNSDYKFYKAENLSFVKGLDKCVILYDNDIAMISDIIRVVHKLSPNKIILVRTKIDQHTTSNVRTINEEKILDQMKIKELLGIDLNVFCVSSHNFTNGKNIYDWDKLKQAIGL